MRRFSLMLTAIIIAGLFGLTEPAEPARAQGGYTHTWDLTLGDGGFTVFNNGNCWADPGGLYVPGVGWEATISTPSTCSGSLNYVLNTLQIKKTLSTPASDVYNVTVTYNYITGDLRPSPQLAIGESESSWWDQCQNCGDGNGQAFGDDPHGSVSGIWIFGASAYQLNADPITDPGTVVFTSVTLSSSTGTDPYANEGNGGLGNDVFKPVSSPDLVWLKDDHTVAETRPNANIHSISSGRILTISSEGGRWYTSVLPTGQDITHAISYGNLQSINGKVNDEITAGCVLGLAASGFDTHVDPGSGNLILAADAETQANWPDFDDAPDNTPCDASKYAIANCLTVNSGFADNAKDWNQIGHVEAGVDNVTLYSDGTIYQDVVLDPLSTYIVTIYATTALGVTSADLAVTFGDVSSLQHLAVPLAQEKVILTTQATAPGTADFAPDKYTLTIRNVPPTGHLATPVIISFVCIGTTDPATAPGNCYFADPANKQDVWFKGDGVTYIVPPIASINPAVNTGIYDLPPDTLIFRALDISAFVNHQTQFTLTVRSSPRDGTPLTGPYGRLHAFIRDHDSEDLLQDIGTWDTDAIVYTNHDAVFTLEEGEHVVGDLVIQNISDLINETGWHLGIHSVCLSVAGGVWPGYTNPAPSPFVAECTQCSQPAPIRDIATNGLLSWLGSWLQYGWCYLGFILRCLIMARLNDVWQTIISFMGGVALFGVWLGMVFSAFAAWVGDGLRFTWNNALAGLITLFNSFMAWLLALPFVQSLIDTGTLALVWVVAFFDLIMAIFNLFGLAISFIGALLHLVGLAFSAFISGMSAVSPITFPFPDCTNPADPLYQACIPFDVMNYLFSQLPALAVLIDVAVAATAWRQIKKTWRAASEALQTQ
jgi:hypothetical protein